MTGWRMVSANSASKSTCAESLPVTHTKGPLSLVQDSSSSTDTVCDAHKGPTESNAGLLILHRRSVCELADLGACDYGCLCGWGVRGEQQSMWAGSEQAKLENMNGG